MPPLRYNHGAGGRPSAPILEHKDDILEWYRTRISQAQILQRLKDDKGLTISLSTLKNYLKEWNASRFVRTQDTDQLRARIQVLFYGIGISDTEILMILNHEGYTITKHGLLQLRRDLGLHRAIRSVERMHEAEEIVQRLVAEEMTKGVIQGFGRAHLHKHFRTRGLAVSRDRLFSVYRTQALEFVQRRQRDIQRVRGEYDIRGPNQVWSIDGHLKLEAYGIEIYGGIDAYARYIPWMYIGISGRTQISALRGYLDAIQELKIQPRFIRSDRGTETPLVADAHLLLQQSYEPDLQLKDCYFYGTSTSNQRIEAWWSQLTKSLLWRWQQYFHSLREQGLFSKDILADQIALLAIYFPLIRIEVANFVRNWNSKPIRKQRNRPNTVKGKPFMLYHYPAPHIQNYGLEVDPLTLARLQEDIAEWDPQEYLPAHTLSWCNVCLAEIGFDPYAPPPIPAHEQATPHSAVYLELRTKLSDHIIAGNQQGLALSEKPQGGRNWRSAVHTQDTNTYEIIDDDDDNEIPKQSYRTKISAPIPSDWKPRQIHLRNEPFALYPKDSPAEGARQQSIQKTAKDPKKAVLGSRIQVSVQVIYRTVKPLLVKGKIHEGIFEQVSIRLLQKAALRIAIRTIKDHDDFIWEDILNELPTLKDFILRTTALKIYLASIWTTAGPSTLPASASGVTTTKSLLEDFFPLLQKSQERQVVVVFEEIIPLEEESYEVEDSIPKKEKGNGKEKMKDTRYKIKGQVKQEIKEEVQKEIKSEVKPELKSEKSTSVRPQILKLHPPREKPSREESPPSLDSIVRKRSRQDFGQDNNDDDLKPSREESLPSLDSIVRKRSRQDFGQDNNDDNPEDDNRLEYTNYEQELDTGVGLEENPETEPESELPLYRTPTPLPRRPRQGAKGNKPYGGR